MSQAERVLYVKSKLTCLGQGLALPIIVSQVLVSENGGFLAVPNSFFYPNVRLGNDISDTDPTFRVYKLAGSVPFLTSVTSRASYSRVSRVWTDSIRDPNVSKILMAMFNVTCPGISPDGRNAIVLCDHDLEGEQGIYAGNM